MSWYTPPRYEKWVHPIDMAFMVTREWEDWSESTLSEDIVKPCIKHFEVDASSFYMYDAQTLWELEAVKNGFEYED